MKIRVGSEYEEIVKIFQTLAGSRMMYQVFTDWVHLTACAISNSVDLFRSPQREQEYLSVAKGYTEEELKKMANVTAILTLTMERNPWRDTLGNLYMQLNMGSSALGQVFTPYSVSLAMAMSVFSKEEVERKIKERGYIKLLEPSCGGGSTIIAACEVLYKYIDINYQSQVVVIAQDLSRVTALMCYIVLSLMGVQAVIKVGDTLSDPYTNYTNETRKKSDIWVTPMCVLKGGHWKV